MVENPSLHTSIQFQLLEKFPLLLPQNKHFTHYDGYVKVEDKLWRLSLDLPNYPSLSGVRIQCSWDLEAVIRSMTPVTKLSETCHSIPQYLSEFCKILETCLQKQKRIGHSIGLQEESASNQQKILMTDDRILSELQTLGSDHVSRLSPDLRTISVVAPDDEGNLHEMTLEISQNYPNNPSSDLALTVVNTDLPKPVCNLIEKEPHIGAAYQSFSQHLLTLAVIWKQLKLLDSQSWVVDPSHPKRADMYRRIFVDAPKVMAQISWNPLHPLNKPEIMFQGAESEVEEFRDNYESNLEKWSQDCDIITNMCQVLNLPKLPVREEQADDVNLMQRTGECCICMCEQCNGSLPSISCGQCLSCFHATCLFEWFAVVSKNRVVHHHITGNCPNCETEIKCPDPTVMDLL